jgi:predicted DNA-binding transcriptional regulator YafY
MKEKFKISSTAYRVLLLMKLLNKSDYSAEELNKVFTDDPYIARSFSKEVILKYISTLRSAGYKISKPIPANKYSYRLIKSPLTINLTSDDIKTLAYMENHVHGLYQDKLEKNYFKLIEKISSYMSDSQLAYLGQIRNELKGKIKDFSSKYAQYAPLIKKIEKYCLEDQRVTIKYKFHPDDEEKQMVIEPKGLKYTPNGVYISGYNSITGEKQLLHLNTIQEIKQLPNKSRYNSILSPVIYKLKGRLAKGYRLYEGEKVACDIQDDGTLTIAAYVEDRNLLLQRLLKYGDFCEVIYPKSVRESMISIINNALKNYDIDA